MHCWEVKFEWKVFKTKHNVFLTLPGLPERWSAGWSTTAIGGQTEGSLVQEANTSEVTNDNKQLLTISTLSSISLCPLSPPRSE